MSRACCRLVSFGLAILIGWVACIRKAPEAPTPPPPAPPPPIRVPKGCLSDLSGTYVAALNPTFNYLAADDGGTLSMAVQRQGDAGVSKPDSNPIFVTLSRTANGFVGQTRAMVYVISGLSCSVDFPTELVGCEDGGLLLRSAMGNAVAPETCRPSTAGDHWLMADHRLVRISGPRPATPADAGSDSQE